MIGRRFAACVYSWMLRAFPLSHRGAQPTEAFRDE